MVPSTPTDNAGSVHAGTIQIPDVIPIFPLPRTVLLPGEVLPLHIFEPRYRELVRDALAGHRVFGIVTLDTEGGPAVAVPSVTPIGCVGFIAQHQELPDGRYLLWLVGLERFHIDSELEVPTQYRQARVTYQPDDEPAPELAGLSPLRQELRALLPRLVDIDDEVRGQLEEQMQEVSDLQLVALGAQILELGPGRKQALLEAPDQVSRFLMLYEDLYTHLEINPELGEVDPGQLN